MSDRLKKLFWFGVSTAIIGFLIYTADVNKFIAALKTAQPAYLALALLAGFGVQLCWSLNWYNFFSITGIKESFFRTYRLFMSGQLLNSITPLGQFGGQPFMAYIISSHSNETRYEKALATVMSADLLAAIPLSTFVILGGGYLFATGSADGRIVEMTSITLFLLAAGGTIGYIGWFKPGKLEAFILGTAERFYDVTGKGQNMVKEVEKRLETVEDCFTTVGRTPKGIALSLGIAHMAFLSKMAVLYMVLASLGLKASPLHMMLIIPVSGLANFSPTPGGSGTYEAAMAGLLVYFMGIELALALTVAILYRLCTYWLNVTVGYVSMTTMEQDFSDLKSKVPS